MKDVVSDVNDDARIQEAFSLFDKDNSGEIELDELGIFNLQKREYFLEINFSSDTIMKQLGEELKCAQIMVGLFLTNLFITSLTFRR